MSDDRNQVIEYISERFAQEDEVLKKVLENQRAGQGPQMNIGPDQGKLLELLVKIHKSKKILEVGSYYGYSSIWLARALRDLRSEVSIKHKGACTDEPDIDGIKFTDPKFDCRIEHNSHHPEQSKGSQARTRDPSVTTLLQNDRHLLTCVEVSDKQCEILEEHFKLAKLEEYTEIIQGSGLDIMNKFLKEQKLFDMIFIDADKANYPNYLTLSIDLLPSGGLLLVDNTLWNGKVADPSITDDKQTNSIREFNDHLSKSEYFDSLIVTIQDGLAIGIKK